jgi:hypothetical protein
MSKSHFLSPDAYSSMWAGLEFLGRAGNENKNKVRQKTPIPGRWMG